MLGPKMKFRMYKMNLNNVININYITIYVMLPLIQLIECKVEPMKVTYMSNYIDLATRNIEVKRKKWNSVKTEIKPLFRFKEKDVKNLKFVELLFYVK